MLSARCGLEVIKTNPKWNIQVIRTFEKKKCLWAGLANRLFGSLSSTAAALFEKSAKPVFGGQSANS
jgi:hypothetical protein